MIVKFCHLGLMFLFYLCYFGKMILQKKQGIDTDQLGKGKEGFVKFVELTLKSVTYFIPLVQIISIILYKDNSISRGQFVGVCLSAAGVLSFVLSVSYMKDNWRAGVQPNDMTNLVTNGIYAISRNPAFLGFDLMYIGILVSFFNLFLCFITCIALLLFHLQIVNVEEDYLMVTFGQEYLDYRKKVRRYLGRKMF